MDSTGVSRRSVRKTVPSRSTTPARIFVPPTSIPMVRWGAMTGGYHNAPHGPRREAVPRLSRGSPGAEATDAVASQARQRPPCPAEADPKAPVRPPGRRALRWVGIGFSVFLLWVAAWSLAGYFSFRDGVKAANKRLPASAERQLSGQGGLLLTKPTTILLLGTDTGPGEGQRGLRHSDSMMLVRTDPDHHRLTYLSIPRDL